MTLLALACTQIDCHCVPHGTWIEWPLAILDPMENVESPNVLRVRPIHYSRAHQSRLKPAYLDDCKFSTMPLRRWINKNTLSLFARLVRFRGKY
jgi:hypothetical protein